MTSFSLFGPAIVRRAAVLLACGCMMTPLAAQDLRDIPQRTNSSVTGPQSQPKAPPRQGREVQGPPAPLETQLRDTPPDDPVVRAPTPSPQPQPQVVAPSAAPQPDVRADDLSQGQRRAPATAAARSRTAPPVSRQDAPQAAPMAAPRQSAAPAAGTMAGSGSEAASGDAATVGSPTPEIVPVVEDGADASAQSDSTAAGAATSAEGWGDTMPWALGALAVLGLGGLGYWATRKRPAQAAGAADYTGIELGQTPFHDPVTEPALPATAVPQPIAAKAKTVLQPKASHVVTAAPEPALPPVTPTSDGRIVSRLRAPTDAAPPPFEPVKPAADGRIVSRLKVSDFTDDAAEPAPPPPPSPQRAPAPQVRTISVGYATPKR